jgi:hypothetical protein
MIDGITTAKDLFEMAIANDSQIPGNTVIDLLPRDKADEYLIDTALCGYYNGKPYIIAAIDAAARGDEAEAAKILMRCREEAGLEESAQVECEKEWNR